MVDPSESSPSAPASPIKSLDRHTLSAVLQKFARGMQANSTQLQHLEDQMVEVENRLGEIEARLGELEFRLGDMEARLGQMIREQERTNLIVETYQKASGQVVTLAFGLIAIATLTIIFSTVLGNHGLNWINPLRP
jgi:hypothetical protein